MREGTNYLTLEDFLDAAVEALGAEPATVRRMIADPLAESALAAPAAGFGGSEKYPVLALKVAVLLQRIASNHALPDGNKRTALLCAILFANLNGRTWVPPEADEGDPLGKESADAVEAAAAGGIPLAVLASWVKERLRDALPDVPSTPSSRAPSIIYAAEYVGHLDYEDHSITVGDLTVPDVHGFNPASVYVRRVSGKVEGISVAEIIISAVGDGYAQEELDQENDEAERYPLGPKEYWRGKMVGKYTNGTDQHLMTNEEFEAGWDDAE